MRFFLLVFKIKFKDEELNKQYAELKEQYDRDYKKYKDARDSQLQNLKDIQEIEGTSVTKQLCNRLLEPFMWHTVLLTGTEFENFFELRLPSYVIDLDDLEKLKE